MASPASTPPESVKRESSASLTADLDSVPPKRQAQESNGVAHETPNFLWPTCDNRLDLERLKIKENAMNVAEDNCAKIREALEFTISQIQSEKRSKTSTAMHSMIKHWLQEYDSLRQEHRSLEVLVGVEGPTGAGKSSFLDSLIGIQEVFPSGQRGAATAVVSKVSWNWSDAPGERYCAKVTFSKKSHVEETLRSLLEDVKALLAVDNTLEDVDNGDSEAREVIEYRVQYEMAKVKAVWGLETRHLEEAVREQDQEDSLYDLVCWILNRNPQVHEYLDKGVIEFKRETLDEIKTIIKPFMISRSSKFGTNRSFAIWPLVEDVHIYLKSDVLKSGITLVDLPGCSDSNASRSEIAKNFSRRLDVRLVVSPIFRAADESQGQALMQSGFDETQMKIRGKYDGRGFGIVLSKTDQFDVDKLIDDIDELSKDPETKQKRERLEALREEITMFEKKIKRLKSKQVKLRGWETKRREGLSKAAEVDNPQTQDSRQALIKEREQKLLEILEKMKKVTSAIQKHQASILERNQEMVNVEDWLHYTACQARNIHVQEQILETYTARQRELDHCNTNEYALPMFPVSTEAFWRLEERKEPKMGYSTLEATGVPAAKRWLCKVTSSKRENHLDEMLNKYQSQLNLMKSYSQEKCQDTGFEITRSSVESILDPIHHETAVSLGIEVSMIAMDIDLLDPFVEREQIKNVYTGDVTNTVKGWRLNDAKDESSGPIWAGTYAAILRRGGELYTSKGRRPMTYDWNEDLASSTLKIIAKNWDSQIRKRVKYIIERICAAFRTGWQHYTNKLHQAIDKDLPGLGLSFNKLDLMLANILRIHLTKIRKIMARMSKAASKITVDAVDFTRATMDPTYKRALEFTGSGAHIKRQRTVERTVINGSREFSELALQDLEAKQKGRKDEAKEHLDQVSREAINSLKQQVSTLLDGLLDNDTEDSSVTEKKFELQRRVRAHIDDWERAWQQEEQVSEQIRNSTAGVSEQMEQNHGADNDANDWGEEDESDVLFDEDDMN